MIRGYYFRQQLADIIKQEMKHNFCSVKIELDWSFVYRMKGKGKGKGKGSEETEETEETPETPDKVTVIIVCRNTRDVLGEKGAKLRLLSHKDSDDDHTGGKGKGGGRKGKKGYSPEEAAEEEPPVQKKVKQPKWKPPPEPRREIPEFDTEQWMACALRCAKFTDVLQKEETFAPVKMLLGDPLNYAVRLWREYNLRASNAFTKAREPETPWGAVGDWGAAVGDWGDVGDGWGSAPTDWTDPWVEPNVQDLPTGPLSEAEKLAARAQRFGATTKTVKAPSGLVVRDFGSDEDVHLENLDVSHAAALAAVIAAKMRRKWDGTWMDLEHGSVMVS